MTGLSTSPQLLQRLVTAAKRPLSEVEVRAQKVSYIMSSVDEESTITRDQIERVVKEHEGQPAS